MNMSDIKFGGLIVIGVAGSVVVTLGLIYVATLVIKWA